MKASPARDQHGDQPARPRTFHLDEAKSRPKKTEHPKADRQWQQVVQPYATRESQRDFEHRVVHVSLLLPACSPANPAHCQGASQCVDADVYRAADTFIRQGLMPFIGSGVQQANRQTARRISGFPNL